ncbi:MAG: alkaline phosphatase family protein [Candidatus Bathyarchaeota archaeon]|nr:alkaline phosphatase family protein [Candidatus Bathyarchaeota archaeon]
MEKDDMMRVFVLALDGLSHKSVSQWNLKYLKQAQHGYIPSIINRKHGEPLSPQVWGSFITGKIQDIDDWQVYTKPMNWIRWHTPIQRIRGSSWLINKTLGRKVLIPILNLIKLQRRFAGNGELRGVPIFDLVPDSIAVNVPLYNLDSEWLFGCTRKILEGDLHAFEGHVTNNAELMIQETYRRIPEKWDLFMTWIPIADQMGHVFVSRSRKMRDLYTSLNMLAYNISSRLPEDCLLVIVSDHGMKISSDGVSGCHSNHAFYSFNRKIDWKPQKITDFYNFIRSTVSSYN